MTTTSIALTHLQATIARALALKPVDRARIEKAAALIAFGHVDQIAPDAYRVRSQTDTNASAVEQQWNGELR